MADTFAVKGMHFRGEEVKAIVRGFETGEILTLEAEPENEYDPFAVKVFYEGVHIGYVEKGCAPIVTTILEEDPETQVKVVQLAHERNNVYPICEIID